MYRPQNYTYSILLQEVYCPLVVIIVHIQALRVSDGLQAGTVFVNTYNKTDVAAPFGGFKQSGFGKDLGKVNPMPR